MTKIHDNSGFRTEKPYLLLPNYTKYLENEIIEYIYKSDLNLNTDLDKLPNSFKDIIWRLTEW